MKTPGLSQKAESLADKMNALTKHITTSNDMDVLGGELVDLVHDKTKNISLYSEDDLDETTATDVVSLDIMIQDFKYVRETLRECTDNARKVLNNLSLDLLGEDEDSRAGLITSFAELNRSIGDNMKLYMQSYKDISGVLINLGKIKESQKPIEQGTSSITNNLFVTEATSTADIIRRLTEK